MNLYSPVTCIETTISLDKILEAENLSPLLSEEECIWLGQLVVENFDMDRASRSQWEQRMEMASKIALQVMERKSFPWDGASNVKFPLLTIACLQYHSRAYPALVEAPNLVKCAAVGADPQGEKMRAAERIAEHMSWQLLEEDEAWEEEQDKALLIQALMGCAFKKSYWDATMRRNVSECILPQDLVVSYYTRSLEKCPRLTHILYWTHNDLMERMLTGSIEKTDCAPPKATPIPFGLLDELRDKGQGLSAPTQDPEQPFIILEQHLWLDLDGDNLKEPYIALVRYDTRQLLRLRTRCLASGVIREGDVVIRFEPERFFTKIPFIPSPDGGFYGLGFGSLLGPLNDSIDTSINQLFDAGTMSNAGGGFLGRGARLRKGDNRFRPGEWKPTDSTGDDLRKSILPLMTKEPSPTLLQLLTILIEYGQRVAGAPDVVQGQNPGQNTPAETSRTMLEQGIKIFSGIYKRAYRSLKEEFRKLYRLNQLHLEEEQEFLSARSGLPMKALAQDYKLPSSFVRPVADPYYMSDAQRMNQAQALMQAAHSNPGYDLYQVNRIYLQAWKIPGIDIVLPDPKGPSAIPPPPNPKLQIEQLKVQAKQMELQMQMKLKLFELMEEHDLNRAKIVEMETRAALNMATADGIGRGHAIAELESAIGVAKLRQEGRVEGIKILRDLMKMTNEEQKDGQTDVGGMASTGGDKGVSGAAAAAPVGIT